MKRLMEETVLSGLVTAWRRANRPTNRSPFGVTATTEGVSRSPSAFGMTVGSPPSMVAMTELVVPRSIPIVRAIFEVLLSQNLTSAGHSTCRQQRLLDSAFGGRLVTVAVAHLALCRSENFTPEPVARRINGDDRITAAWFHLHRIMHGGIELLPHGVYRYHAVLRQRGHK